MTDFATDILSSIRNDNEFKYNPVVMAVVDSLESRRGTFATEEKYLGAIKESLSGANAYVKNQRLEDIIMKVDVKLCSESTTNVHAKTNSMYYEIDIPGAIKAIREASIYSEPVVKKYIDSAMLEMQTNRSPYFKYLPGFIGTMSMFRTDAVVNEWVTRFENYLKDNTKKLIMLETVHYLDGIGNGFYNHVTEKLKGIIVSGDCNSAKIMLEMNQFTTIPVIKNMVMAIQSHENADNSQFRLGDGDGNTKVYNYIGPVLKENNSIVMFADGTFISIASSAVDEKNIERPLGKSGDMLVNELKAEYVYESMSEYYQIAKSFEYLNFNVKDKGVRAKLRNIGVDFNVNESGNLDLYINDQLIEDPKKLNYRQMFVLENSYVKNCSTILFNNMDKIYNVDFVKLLVNESRNAAAMIINVNEDYYVYDFVDAKKRDIYKADGFRLQKFVFEKFGYDVRELFKIQINDVKAKVMDINEKQLDLMAAIKQLEESAATLDQTIAKPGIKAEDLIMMKELREKVEREIVSIKNAYIMLEDQKSAVLCQNDTQEPEEYKLGDTVNFGDANGRIVAVPADANSKDYMVYTSEGRTQKVQKENMTKSAGKPQQPVQPTNEAKKEEDSQKAQEDAQKEKDEKAQKEKDEKAQKAQEDAQKSQQPQQAQEDAQRKPEDFGNVQSAQSQPAQQGIVPDNAPSQAAQSQSAGFKGVSDQLGVLRSALDTVRPEVKDKFQPLVVDLDILIKQTGELERLHGEIEKIEKAEGVDFAKVETKFDKIAKDLEKVTAELTGEFGQGAQQVVISESMITSAYDKYIAVVSSVAGKLTAKVSTIVKKLGGEIIDLDADVKVLAARADAAKAKGQLNSQSSGTGQGEIPVSGAQPDASMSAQTPQATQTPQAAQDAPQAQFNFDAEKTQQPQAQQAQVQQAQEPEKKVNENAEGFFSQADFDAMTNEELASEYADVFGLDESEVMAEVETKREDYINQLIEKYNQSLKSRGINADGSTMQ